MKSDRTIFFLTRLSSNTGPVLKKKFEGYINETGKTYER